MRLSTALPLVLLPALTLAHNDPLRPAHHRRQLARHGHVAYGKRVPAFDDIFGGGSTSSSVCLLGIIGCSTDAATSTASDDGKSTSGAAAATSAVASTSEAATTTNKAEASTSTADTSSTASGTSQAATSTVNPSSAGKSSAATSATGSSSASASASASASRSGSTSGAGSTPASSPSTSSSQSTSSSPSKVTENTSGSSSPTTSAARSVQYTTDSSGQTQMITVVLTESAADDDDSSTANAAATASSTAATKKDDGSLSTGAIIGICVGVGVAVLALIGLALCRMRRRSSDEDEAIRWPELNRHGDSDVHHALPARETGQHGFETSGMSRPLSSGSSIHYADYPAEYGSAGGDYLGTPMPHTPVPMALGGSNFGAGSTLEDEYDEKYSPAHLDHSATHLAGGPPSPNPDSLNEHDNYSSLPPPVQPTPDGLGMGNMMYGQGHPSPNPSEHAMLDNEDVYGGMGAQSVQMTQMGARGGVTYPHAALTSPVPEYGMEYPDYPRGGY